MGAIGCRVEHAELRPSVERVEQVHRRRRSVGQDLPCQVGPVGEPGGQRIDQVPPAVAREGRTGQLEDPRAVITRIEIRDGGPPVLGHLLGPVVAVGQVAVLPDGEEGAEGQDDHGPDADP